MADGWVPIISLALLALLQNVDVIVARHELGDDRAGSYAVAAVAAKVVIWVAIGVGLQLLPQATAPRGRRARTRGRCCSGRSRCWPRSPRRRCCSSRSFPTFILRTAFGPDTVDAAPALLAARPWR